MNRHVPLQVIEETASIAADFGRVRASHSVDEFSERDRRYSNLDLSEGLFNGREQVCDRLSLSFRRNDDAGIENQSQEGGFHG